MKTIKTFIFGVITFIMFLGTVYAVARNSIALSIENVENDVAGDFFIVDIEKVLMK